MFRRSEKCQVNSFTEEFLRLCSLNYDMLIEKMEHLKKKGSAEAVLTWIEMAAGFAAMHHPGRFADGTIENIALEIGSNLPCPRGRRCQPVLSTGTRPRKKSPTRRVLHVTTFVTAPAGHPRVILNWIRKDMDSQHSLVLTRQQSAPILPELSDAVTFSGGQFVSLPDEVPIIERARWLRQFALETADLVVLHTIPNDVVPVVAFADETGVPVAFVNNADHLFWLGSSVADVIINLREISITANKIIRYTRNDQLLPIPLTETHQTLSRSCAREILGIPKSQTMLLSVGRPVKYYPSHRQNFFRTAKEILDRNSEAHLYLVGVKKEDHAGSPLFVHHNRMHLVGPVEDATLWQKASDVYLEGFPFGSQTALLESILQGIPCVRVFAPLTPLLAADDIVLTGLVIPPVDEEEYIEQAVDFISDRNKRIRTGEMLRERVLVNHVDKSWNKYLEKIYQTMQDIRHIPSDIPQANSSSRQIDLAISEYHGSRFIGNDLETVLRHVHRDYILGSAYSLRQSGFHSDAFRFVRLANIKQKWDWESILFTAKILPHRFIHKTLTYHSR